MKGISCNSNLLSDLSIDQAINVLARYGYDAIDVCLELAPPFVPIPTPHMSPNDNAATRQRVRKCAEKAGIAIAALNAHTNLSARDPQTRKTNVGFVEASMQLAADLGSSVVVAGGGSKNAYGYEQWFFDWLIDSLRQLLPTAEKLGITLALEAGSPPGCLLYNIKTMQKLLATEGLDSVRVLFDPAHFTIRGDNPVEAFKALKNKVVHMHAKDADGGPENIIFPPLGEGRIDFDALFGEMRAAEFAGCIAVEYEAFAWGFPRDYKTVLPREKAFLDRFISKHWK